MARGRNKGDGTRDPTSHRTPAQTQKHIKGYLASPEQRKKRALRNKARRAMIKSGKVARNDGKDVGHKTPLSKGGSNSKSNLAVQSVKKNRGHGMSPGVSPAERKKYGPKKKTKAR